MRAHRLPFHGRHLTKPQGITLVMTLVFLAILSLLGSTAVTIISTDLLLGSNYKASQSAFYNAEAGVNYAMVTLSDLIDDGTIALDGSREAERYRFRMPTGFTFHIDGRTTLTRVADTRKYVLQVTGRPRPKSPIRRTVEVVLQRQSALPYGIAGVDRVDLPESGAIYSYDSRRTGSWGPSASTGAVKLASNGVVTAQSAQAAIEVDGQILLGTDPDGTQAHFAFRDPSPGAEPPPTTVPVGNGHELHLHATDMFTADPLDVETLVEDTGTRFSVDNSNGILADALPYSAVLEKGDYYLRDIKLGRGMFLILDARKGDVNVYSEHLTFTDNAQLIIRTDGGTGKVNVYLDGPASFGSSSSLNQPGITMQGAASDFRLFSKSREPIDFYHRGNVYGLVYAPFAAVTVQNTSATGYGLLWGRTVALQGDGAPYTFYVDTATADLFLSNSVEMVSWKELRD